MRFPFFPVAVFAAFVGLASPCHSNTVYVSGVGSDANSCSRTAPCQSFSTALSKTQAGGEIDCLDAGEYSSSLALTITASVSIICDGLNGRFSQNVNPNAITVNLPAATDKVVLSGLNLDGLTVTTLMPAATGVLVQGLGTVTIRNSTIKNFTSAGVALQGSAGSPATRVVIQNSYITNSGIGVNVTGTGGTRVFIKDSFIENGSGGVSINGSGPNNSAAITSTTIDNNSSYALNVGPTGNAAALVNSIISGSPAGLIIGSGGVVNSFGPSNVITGTGAPTASTPYR